MMSGFDYLLRAQEANILNRILGGSLTYRITGLPDGKRLIHLYNASIELVEEGYSDIEIKAYFKELFSEANQFTEEYWAL